MSVSKEELKKAQDYYDEFVGPNAKYKLPQFSPSVESWVSKAKSRLTVFDIETADLQSNAKAPIYEMGFMHVRGPDKADFVHQFVSPTNIEGNAPGEWSEWSAKARDARDSASGGTFTKALSAEGIPQKDAPNFAFKEMWGRDVLIQNTPHERAFIKERMAPGEFEQIAKDISLESRSSGGLYPTDIGIKKRAIEATRIGRVGSKDQFLSAWEKVFTEGFLPAFENLPNELTRSFENMDLTKSVFAMAQRRGLMDNAGELFTGTSVSTFANAMWGIEELHAANPDNVLQERMFHAFMASGKTMHEGKDLPPEMIDFFRRVGESVPQQKQQNAVKNIINTYRDQQEFLASQAEGNPRWSLLEGSRTSMDRELTSISMDVLNEQTGASTRVKIDTSKRAALHPETNPEAFTTDIGKLVEFWKERDSRGHGVVPDYDRALREAQAQYIDEYEAAREALEAKGSPKAKAIRSALAGTSDIAEAAIKQAASDASSGPQMGRMKTFIRNNWKIGLMGAGVLMAANLISGDDDSYNYIEGMRHGGIAGWGRKSNTDFGSGWQGLRAGRGIFAIPQHAFENFAKIGGGSTPAGFVSNLKYLEGFVQRARRWSPEWEKAGDELLSGLNDIRSDRNVKATGRAGFLSVTAARELAGHTGTSLEDSLKAIITHEELHENIPAYIQQILRKESAYLSRIGLGISKPRSWTPRGDFLEEMAAYRRENYSYPLPGSERVPEEFHNLINRAIDATEENERRIILGRTPISYHNRFSAFDDAYNTIEGLRHTGFGGHTRRRTTDFGSGWRGLIKVLDEDAFVLFGLGQHTSAGGVMQETAEQIIGRTINRPSEGLVNQLRQAQERGHSHPVFINEKGSRTVRGGWKETQEFIKQDPEGWQKALDHFSDLAGSKITTEDFIRGDKDALKATIKHERFHQKLRAEHGSEPIRGEAPAGWNELAAKRYGDKPENLYEEYLAHREEYSHYPEALLHSDPYSYAYFRRQELAGELGETPARRRMRMTQERAERRLLRNSPPQADNRIQSNISGNTIAGQQEESQITGKQGFGAKLRKFFGFGSPWQGLRVFASDLATELSEQYAMLSVREKRQEERKKRRQESYLGPQALNPRFEGDLSEISISNFTVEDADTIKFRTWTGEEQTLRLAGIDAPEVSHGDDTGKIFPDQPYGEEAKARLEQILGQQQNLRAIIDSSGGKTHGRSVAMLIGDGNRNINLQLVQEGMAASLPFGKRSTQITDATEFNRAEEDAAAAREGMWSTEAWQLARQAQLNNHRKITNVSYTDLGRLFSNFKTSSILLRMQNPDADFSEMTAAGDRSDHNLIEGMRHGWIGANRAANLGDFSSPYQIDKAIPKSTVSYASKKRVIEGQYAANTQLRLSMKRENRIQHNRG